MQLAIRKRLPSVRFIAGTAQTCRAIAGGCQIAGGHEAMSIDFTLTAEQQRLQADARTFARDVLTQVAPATRSLATPLARFTAMRPFYEQAVSAGFLRRLIPEPLGGEG